MTKAPLSSSVPTSPASSLSPPSPHSSFSSPTSPGDNAQALKQISINETHDPSTRDEAWSEIEDWLRPFYLPALETIHLYIGLSFTGPQWRIFDFAKGIFLRDLDALQRLSGDNGLMLRNIVLRFEAVCHDKGGWEGRLY